MHDPHWARSFRRIGIITIFAVYFLILVGGIVRASGAGMGCPDWPTCFGQWIPPISESELPKNYHEIYRERGYADTNFNPVKTWTEYVNRLVGVAIGFLIILTVYFSFPYLKKDKIIFYLSLVVLFAVGFQGWLGSVVVASNLHPVMITLHMLLAMVIVVLLIYAIMRSQHDLLKQIETAGLTAKFKTILTIAMGMTLVQVAMGTQIRETVDMIARNHEYLDRRTWRNDFPIIFYVHRTFSALILFINLWLVWEICKKVDKGNALFTSAISLAGLVVIAIVTGMTLDRLGFPAFVQPIHLLMANLIFGVQFFILTCVRYSSGKTKRLSG